MPGLRGKSLLVCSEVTPDCMPYRHCISVLCPLRRVEA